MQGTKVLCYTTTCNLCFCVAHTMPSTAPSLDFNHYNSQMAAIIFGLWITAVHTEKYPYLPLLLSVRWWICSIRDSKLTGFSSIFLNCSREFSAPGLNVINWEDPVLSPSLLSFSLSFLAGVHWRAAPAGDTPEDQHTSAPELKPDPFSHSCGTCCARSLAENYSPFVGIYFYQLLLLSSSSSDFRDTGSPALQAATHNVATPHLLTIKTSAPKSVPCVWVVLVESMTLNVWT